MTRPTDDRHREVPPDHDPAPSGAERDEADTGRPEATPPGKATAEAEKARTEIEAGDVADDLADFA